MATDDKLPFSNVHSHVFTADHAPDYFLKTAIPNEWLAKAVDRLLQKGWTREVLKVINLAIKPFSPNYRHTVERYIEFIEIGTSATQQDIFDMEAQAYTSLGKYRIVALTQVLDYLDYDRVSNHKKIQTQVQEIVDLKRSTLYQQRLYPFLGVDPRMQGVDLLKWVKKYISKDYGFYGIKIYPAYGFFPFDNRLDDVWKWASDMGVPVMTHCTRGGSFYLGSFDSVLNRGGFQPKIVPPDPFTSAYTTAVNNISQRIRSLVTSTDKKVKKDNQLWCNIFGYPENYIPVLEKYPNLKICLAHLGGGNEINRIPLAGVVAQTAAGRAAQAGQSAVPGAPTLSYPDYLNENWYIGVIDLMATYPRVYSDISYTLSNKPAMDTVVKFFKGKPLTERLLYGTEFYMTQEETKGDEPDLINQFLSLFGTADINRLAYTNPDDYLRSAIHPNP